MSEVSPPVGKSVTAGAKVCVIAHLSILQERVKEGIDTADTLNLDI